MQGIVRPFDSSRRARRGQGAAWQTPEPAQASATAGLDRPARDAIDVLRAGRRTALGSNKGTARYEEQA